MEKALPTRPSLERFRALGVPFWVAVTLLEQGDAAGLAEARETFERLGATPWVERVRAAEAERMQATA